MKTNYAYPAFFYFDDDGISIEFPDLPGCLPCAKTQEEAFHVAKEAMGLHLFGLEIDGDEIPAPSPIGELKPEDGALVALVDVFMPAIRAKANNKVVKKTLTIPAWLNAAAMERDINFSQVLQDALKAQLEA